MVLVDETKFRISRILLLSFVVIILQPMPFFSAVAPARVRPTGDHSVVRGPTFVALPRQPVLNASRVGPTSPVNPFVYQGQEPAPMGIADYGIGPEGAYQYSTNSSVGAAYVGAISTENNTGDTSMSFQLNVNLQFSVNGKVSVYWIQNVALLDTSSDTVLILDNVWNSSSPRAGLAAFGIRGGGKIATTSGMSYYYDIANLSLPGNDARLVLPTSLELMVNSTENQLGQPEVEFAYYDGFGWQTFDTVQFNTTGSVALSGFLVSGFDYNPRGLFYDSEFILGGPGAGYQTMDLSSDVRLRLLYWNDHNYQMVHDAYNFGSDTAESMGNVRSRLFHSPANGTITAELQAGAGVLARIYDSSQVGIVDVRSTLGSGDLTIANATEPPSSPASFPAVYAFVNGRVTATVYPGEYDLQLLEGGSVIDKGTFSIEGGQTLSLSSPFGAVELTMSYAVVGDSGAGHTAPTLSYTLDGAPETTMLSPTPTIFTLDRGSHWNVSSSLGLEEGERWQTDGPTSGTATSPQTIHFVYYEQFHVTLDYSVVGGGTGFAAPRVECQSYGSTVAEQAGASAWIDSGSSCDFPAALPSSIPYERWATDTHGVQISGSAPISVPYYHQYSIEVDYRTVGGGNDSSASLPILWGTLFGVYSPQWVPSNGTVDWLDAGSFYSLSTLLAASSTTERWSTPTTIRGTVTGTISVAVEYYHQYLVSASYVLVGGGAPASSPELFYAAFGTPSYIRLSTEPESLWTDAGSRSSVPSILATSTSERWYAPAGPWVIEGTASIVVSYFHQFILGAMGEGLASEWYNASSTARLAIPGVLDRSSGSGERVVSYSLDGGVPVVVQPTRGTIYVSVLMDGPHSISTNTVRQYRVTLDAGSIESLASITAPTIIGDDYWYDRGSTVTVTYNYSWNATGGSRTNALGYTVRQAGNATAVRLSREGTGVFRVKVEILTPATITISYVRQYRVTISGGFRTLVEPASSTNDSFYDSGVSVHGSTDYVWDVSGTSRQSLLSYTVDGTTTNVSRAESGTFTTPAIPVDGPLILRFNPIEQYSVTFQFKDSSGEVTITPNTFQISVSGEGVVMPPLNGTWVDAGSRISVSKVLWEDANVAPSNATVFTVDSSTSVVTTDRVYDSQLNIKDYIGVPVSGATVTFDLVNGTRLTATSGSDGSVTLRMIPIGTYNATISYLGDETRVSGDASSQAVVEGRVLASYPAFGTMGVAALVVVMLVLFLLRKVNDRTQRIVS